MDHDGAAATMLGISAQRVGELVDAGELDGYRPTGRRGHRRVSLEGVLARLKPEADAS
jgi:excisionase family DNA binding protein